IKVTIYVSTHLTCRIATMPKFVCLLVAGLLLSTASICYAGKAKKVENFMCNSGQRYEFKLAGYTLQISQPGDSEFPDWCSAVLRNGRFRRKIVREAMSVSILGASGQDVNQD